MSDSVSVTARLPVEAFAEQFQGEMVPLNKTYSYFAALPLEDSQVQQFVQEPIAALPPGLAEILPELRVVLVPYLERANSKGSDLVAFDKPAENRQVAAASLEMGARLYFFLAVKDEDVADFEGVVPMGVEVRGFMRVEADAVAEVMVEDADGGCVQDGLGFIE